MYILHVEYFSMYMLYVFFIFLFSFRISRATNINISFRPKNWSKWTKRSFVTSRQHHHHNNYQEKTGGANRLQSTFKGKLHKIQKWKWSAGWTILSILDWWLLAAGFTWQRIFLRWTPVGICFIAAASWHLHNRECISKGLPKTAPKWQVSREIFLILY